MERACKSAIVAVYAAFIAFYTSAVEAAPCTSAQESGDVSGFSLLGGFKHCDAGSTNNDFLGTSFQVNDDLLFGVGLSPWSLLSRFALGAGGTSVEEDATAPSGGAYSDLITFAPGSTALSGVFTIDEAVRTPLLTDIMVVLKGAAPDVYVGFLVTDIIGAGETGTYASIFFNGHGDAQGISHLTFYGRRGFSSFTGDIPVPAALPLMAGGLAALGLLRLRRRA